jgi:hypothetical protein
LVPSHEIQQNNRVMKLSDVLRGLESFKSPLPPFSKGEFDDDLTYSPGKGRFFDKALIMQGL